MARKRAAKKRDVQPDPKFNDVIVTKFINTIMRNGKRSIAERIFYNAVDLAAEKVNDTGLKVFRQALENVKPMLEVKSRRVGGATYQVPVEVNSERQRSLASRWLIEAASSRPEHSMEERLAAEFAEAFQGRGTAMKKKDDTHRMAEANRAFAHFRW